MKPILLLFCFSVFGSLILAADKTEARGLKFQQGISMEANKTKIDQVVAQIMQASGVEWFLDSDVEGTVSVKLKNVPWEKALDMVLEASNLYKKQNGRMITIFARKDASPSAPLTPLASAKASPPATESSLSATKTENTPLPEEELRVLGVIGPQGEQLAIVKVDGKDRTIKQGDILLNGDTVIEISEKQILLSTQTGQEKIVHF